MSMQNASLDNINPSNLKNFFKELCVVYSRNVEKEEDIQDRGIEFEQLKKYKSSHIPTEKMLRSRVQHLEGELNEQFKKYKSSHITTENMLSSKIQKLEEELQQTREEKNRALGENRNRINELNDALVSIKIVIHELLDAKKHRIRHLERKIRKEVNI